MTVRFSSDSTTGTASSLAFAARIETVDPPCGSYLTLNATSTPQVSLLVYSLRVDLVSFSRFKWDSLHFFTFVHFFSFRYWKVLDIDHQGIILQTLVVNGLQKLLHWMALKVEGEDKFMVVIKEEEFTLNFLVWMWVQEQHLHHSHAVKVLCQCKITYPRFAFTKEISTQHIVESFAIFWLF